MIGKHLVFVWYFYWVTIFHTKLVIKKLIKLIKKQILRLLCLKNFLP